MAGARAEAAAHRVVPGELARLRGARSRAAPRASPRSPLRGKRIEAAPRPSGRSARTARAHARGSARCACGQRGAKQAGLRARIRGRAPRRAMPPAARDRRCARAARRCSASRVRMARRVEDRRHAALLHHLAGIHHGDALDALATTARSWVMRSSAMPRSRVQPRQQLEHLRLHGDVERGGGLVGDQEARVAGDRHRDHHALRHAARKLVRPRVEPRLRVGHLDLAQQLERACAPHAGAGALVGRAMHAQRFADLERDRVARVEAVSGSWKIIAMSLPTIAAPRRRRERGRSRPSNASRRADTRPGKSTRPMIASAVTLLPEPDSPTRPSVSPASQREVEAVDGDQRRVDGVPKSTRRSSMSSSAIAIARQRRELRVERIAQAVAHEVEREHRDQDRQARIGDHPRRALDEFQRRGEHRPPFGRRRLRAEAEEAERRGVEDRDWRSRASPARSAAPRNWAGSCRTSAAAVPAPAMRDAVT